MRQAAFGVLRRELLLALRRRSDYAQPLLFLTLVVTLFPLALGPDPTILQAAGPGILWVAAALATMLSLEGMFRDDHASGVLEQLLLSPHPASLLVGMKMLGHWLATGLPIVLFAPLFALLLNLPAAGIGILVLSLLLGTPVLTLVGGIGAALTLGLPRGGLLIALLVLPLYVPVLIFGAGAVANAVAGLPVAGQLYVLGAELSAALVLAPVATAAAMRVTTS